MPPAPAISANQSTGGTAGTASINRARRASKSRCPFAIAACCAANSEIPRRERVDGVRNAIELDCAVLGHFGIARHRRPFEAHDGRHVSDEPRANLAAQQRGVCVHYVIEIADRVYLRLDVRHRAVVLLPDDHDHESQDHGVENSHCREEKSGDVVMAPKKLAAKPALKKCMHQHAARHYRDDDRQLGDEVRNARDRARQAADGR